VQIATRLAELSAELGTGGLPLLDFAEAAAKIDTEQARPAGLRLVAGGTRDSRMRFSLKLCETGETCASFEFSPNGGEIEWL
jgi:hypothetical protein